MSEDRSPDRGANEENNESVSEKIISYGKEIIKKVQSWDGKVSRAQIWAMIIFGLLFFTHWFFYIQYPLIPWSFSYCSRPLFGLKTRRDFKKRTGPG
ncbi:MAG: hypothetical protein WA130_11750 [Candidatus Methanoperedens sp.]